MKLHELSPAEGSTRPNFRKGRGAGSGNGKTGGRGHKGQNARSGGGVRPGFEGGQLPIYRKLPKRGFHNHFAKHYAIVNLSTLNEFETGEVVDMNALLQAGYIRKELDGLKILGGGELTKKLTVQVNAFSESAKEKIEALGGKAEVI